MSQHQRLANAVQACSQYVFVCGESITRSRQGCACVITGADAVNAVCTPLTLLIVMCVSYLSTFGSLCDGNVLHAYKSCRTADIKFKPAGINKRLRSMAFCAGAMIDRGGNGTVYLGHDHNGALIAIKVGRLRAGLRRSVASW